MTAPGEATLYEKIRNAEERSDLVTALGLCDQWLTLCETHHGRNSVRMAEALVEVGLIHRQNREDLAAEELYQKALNIYRSIAPISVGHAVALNNLATLRREAREPAEAESLLLQASEIREKLAPNDLGTAVCVSNLASVYDSLGDTTRALLYHRRALEIRQRQKAPIEDLAASMVNLGSTLARQGTETGLREALRLLNQAVDRLKSVSRLTYPDLAVALGNRSQIHALEGRMEEALKDTRQTLELTKRAVGEQSYESTIVSNNLASLLARAGMLDEATLLRRSLLSRVENSLDARMKSIKPVLLQNLARECLEQGLDDDARSCAKQTSDLELERLRDFLAYASEDQRLNARSLSSLYSVPGTLEDAAEMARLVLNTKGVVLDSALAQQAVLASLKSTEQKEKWNKLQIIRARLRELAAQDAGANAALKLRSALEEAERKFNHEIGKGAAFFQMSDQLPQQVGDVLREDEMIVEFVRYSRFTKGRGWQAAYGALVIRHHQAPAWTTCCMADEIDPLVLQLLADIRALTEGVAINEAEMRQHLNLIGSKILNPLVATVGKLPRRLWLSGDGLLHLIPFGVVPTPKGNALLEECTIEWIHSARTLLRDLTLEKPGNPATLAIIANPEHNLSIPTKNSENTNPQTSAYALRNLTTAASAVQLDALPATGIEARELSKLALTNDWKIHLGTESNATESFLQTLQNPTILHFACHGIFLTRDDLGTVRGKAASVPISNSPQANESGGFNDPMFRSWLALAGSQNTLDAWAEGKHVPLESDGVLMAAEVAGLDLRNTRLATLSACRTALGEIVDGEGVLGLRRGFAQAGVHHLVTSLWPVDDQATMEWMRSFYKRLFQGQDASSALTDTQRELFKRWESEKGWAWAVYAACPFIIVSHGREPALKDQTIR